MLDRFKVPEGAEVRVTEESLRVTTAAVFEKMGVSTADAVEGANTLVMADLRGAETHGVSNMLRSYVQQYKDGGLNPRPKWKVLRESPGTATIDADQGLVVILGSKAMRLAVEKARRVGIGVVVMNNAGHSGGIGHYAKLATESNMIGMVMSAGGIGVAPTFASEGRLGTNPIAIAAPANKEAPVLFDAATSAIAGNKLRLASRVGSNLLPGWISELDGSPIMVETPLREKDKFYQLPLGSTREQGSHKGYGLALMAEILTTMLSGVLPTMLNPGGKSKHYFAAYDIASFTDVATFKENMDQMLRTLRETKPAPGFDRVLYPGLSENEEERDRRANGVPLHKEVVQWFEDIASDLSIPRLKII